MARAYSTRGDTKDGSIPCFSDVNALSSGTTATPVVAGEIVAPVTPGVCFPSGPSCFSSISDFTIPAVVRFPHWLSLARASVFVVFLGYPTSTNTWQLPVTIVRNDFSSCLVDNVPPPAASPSICSRMKSAYRVRNCLLPSFIIPRHIKKSLSSDGYLYFQGWEDNICSAIAPGKLRCQALCHMHFKSQLPHLFLILDMTFFLSISLSIHSNIEFNFHFVVKFSNINFRNLKKPETWNIVQII